MEIIHVGAGALVGFVIGLTGVGGGSLMTPILLLGFGIPPAIAVGTDLLYAAITKCSGIFFHHRNKTVDWKIVGLLACGSIPASFITISILDYLNQAGKSTDQLMLLTLSSMLILTGVVTLLKAQLLSFVHTYHADNWLVGFVRTYRSYITVLSGVLLGVVVTISSVGAGAIGAAILFLLYPHKRTINIVGTDIAHAVPLTSLAGLGHLHLGSVDFNLLMGLLLGGVPAIYLGSLLGKKLPDRIMRPLVALILFAMGINLALR
ncbi:MAG: sulfite exporter TauE/SafE family protein [Gammaproteobacteria bacterium]